MYGETKKYLAVVTAKIWELVPCGLPSLRTMLVIWISVYNNSSRFKNPEKVQETTVFQEMKPELKTYIFTQKHFCKKLMSRISLIEILKYNYGTIPFYMFRINHSKLCQLLTGHDLLHLRCTEIPIPKFHIETCTHFH